MSLLSPWFLAGALLVAGPIIFHLIRRATKDRIQFSAMRFLRESPPKLQKKSRIQNPWLLALRCLIIVLLAFAFARPFFDSDTPFELATNPPKAIVLAIDSSASMQREGAWENAIQRAGSYLEKVDSADKLSIVSVSTNARLLLSFEQWDKWPVNERATLAEALLSETAPNWGATRLDEAIELALAELEQIDEGAETATEKTVVLISDMQSTSRIAGVAGREWRDECLLELETIQGAHPGNTGIRWLGWTGDERNRSMRIGVQSSGQSLASNLSLALFDAKSNTPLGKTLKLYSNTGDNHMVLLEVPEDATGPFRVELSGDPDTFDNVLSVAENQPRAMQLQYLGDPANSEDPNQSAFYIKRASAGWIDPSVQFIDRSVDSGQETDLPPFLFIDSPLTENEVLSARTQIKEGSHALLLLSNREMLVTATALTGESDWSIGQTSQEDSRLGAIDFQSHAFAIFSDPRFSDFSRIRFWHTHKLAIPDSAGISIVAKYDDDGPAIIEKTMGNGLLTIWVADWAPQKSQWTLSTKFVPWLQRLFERAAGGSNRTSIIRTDSIASAFDMDSAQWKPIGENSYSSETPAKPGLYQLKQGFTERWIAVQAPSEESQWDTLPYEDWERLGAPLEAATTSAQTEPNQENERRSQNAVELESQQQVWKWLIIAVALALIFESLIARALQNREERATA